MRRFFLRRPHWERGGLLFVLIFAADLVMAGQGRFDAVSAPTVSAGVPSKSVVMVTWSDIARLLDRDPRLSVAAFRVEAARRAAGATKEIPNPTLEAAVGRGVARTGGESRVEWGLELTIPLGWIAQRASRIDAAEAVVDVAIAEAKALRRDVLLQLRILFWSVAREQARVALCELLEAQTLALVETVGKRVEKGEVRPVENVRVEIELEKIAIELESARANLSARRSELASWLGLPAGETIQTAAELEALPVAMGRDEALARARSAHPAIAIAMARIRSLAAEVSAERMARVPSFFISGSTSYELDRRAYGVGLAVELPLWNWNSSRIAQAEAELAAGRKQAQAAALSIEASVLEAQSACEASVVAATRYRNHVVPRSEAAADALERAYRLGEASLLEVIDARRALLDSRRLYLSALAQAQIDCSRLDALVGEEFE